MKVLISSRSFGKANSEPMNTLKAAGFDVTLNPYDKKLDENELIELIEDIDGLIAGTEQITESVLQHAKKLKVISRYGVGLDNINLEVANKKGIKVYNTPNAPTKAVAELTLSLILNLLRRIPESSISVKEKNWQPRMGNLLYEKKLGVVGLGRIGKELVKLVQPFALNIIAYEKYPDNNFVTDYNITLKSLEEVLSQSDIISLHLPLTEDTYKIIGTDQFSLMKNNAILVNTARGGLIDEAALVDALGNEKISGAALDVFEKEPYTGKLIDFDNVLLTPHIGSYAEETRKNMEMEAVENLINNLSTSHNIN